MLSMVEGALKADRSLPLRQGRRASDRPPPPGPFTYWPNRAYGTSA
jgi:hypothetical protein